MWSTTLGLIRTRPGPRIRPGGCCGSSPPRTVPGMVSPRASLECVLGGGIPQPKKCIALCTQQCRNTNSQQANSQRRFGTLFDPKKVMFFLGSRFDVFTSKCLHSISVSPLLRQGPVFINHFFVTAGLHSSRPPFSHPLDGTGRPAPRAFLKPPVIASLAPAPLVPIPRWVHLETHVCVLCVRAGGLLGMSKLVRVSLGTLG